MKVAWRDNLLVALFVAALVACGGGAGAKGQPMVADSPSDTSDAVLADDKDGGASASHDGDGGAQTRTGEGAPIIQGNEEGAQALLRQFVAPDADHAALTRSLRPTSSDYKTLFDAPTAAKIEAAQAKDWNSGKAIIKPKANQTEVKIWSATGADIASGKGNAKEFPGGYKKLGKHLAAAVTFFRFKFVETGKEVGTAYDGLAFVNGHWVIAPKPWKAIDGGKGGDDDEGGGEETPKPKPKKKPKKK
jgi:hypothetical protein